jgi:UDP-glucuronate decarboxylase
MAAHDKFIGPVNLGNSKEFTVQQLADEVLKQIPGSTIKREPLPSDDPKVRRPDISLATKELGGWEPQVPLAEGIRKAIPYFKQKLGL